MSGCFCVTALDSLLPGPDGTLRRNESLCSDTVCVDNCPVYDLPNVFTPNGDLFNEQFVPVQWRAVDRVDVQVHNRWGERVYQTEDPNLGWDGTYLDTGEPLPEGVYFVTTTAYTIRLEGIVPLKFASEIRLVRGNTLSTD